MASNSYDKWNNISANFSGSTGFMRNALDGMGQAGTIFSRGAAYFQEEQKRQEALAQNQFENELALQEEARLARVAESEIAINQSKEQRESTEFDQKQEEWIDKQMAVDAYNTFIENTDLESRKDGSYRDSAMYENMPAAARTQLLADWMAFNKEDRENAESQARIGQLNAATEASKAATELSSVQQAALVQADVSGTGSTDKDKTGNKTRPSNGSYTATFKNDLSRLNSIYTDKRFANMGSVASALITFNNTLKTLGDLTSEEQDQIGKAIRSVDQGDMSDEDYIEKLNNNISTALTIVQDDRAKNKPPEGNTPSAPTVGSGFLTNLGSGVQEVTKGLGYSVGKISDLSENDAVSITQYNKDKSLFEQPAPLTAVLTNTKDPSKVVSDWLKYKGDTTPETITAEEIPLAAKLLFSNTLTGENTDKARSIIIEELYNRFNNPQKYTDGKRNYNHLSLAEFRRLLNTSL